MDYNNQSPLVITAKIITDNIDGTINNLLNWNIFSVYVENVFQNCGK